MLHGDHVGKLARRPIDPIKQKKNIGDEPRSDILIELFNCGGGVCGSVVELLWRCCGVVEEVFVEEVFVEEVFVEEVFVEESCSCVCCCGSV